ncbi:MAG: phage tail protein [Martelella sp.]|uniref:phage tail protein n=1 Tax=Martelella sp. TaxID=1969699 RepID=UPI003242E4B4
MRVKTLLTLLVFLTLGAGPAHAAPVFGLAVGIFQAVGAFAASSWIGGLIVNVAFGAVTNLISRAFAGKKKSDQQSFGVKLSMETGDDKPLSVVAGRYATAGKLKYWGTWGNDGETPNAYLTKVLEIGSLPSFAGDQALQHFWIDSDKCTILYGEPHGDGRGYPISEFRQDGNDYAWVRYLDGAQTEADAFLLAKFANAEKPYRPSMIGRGKQAVIVTFRKNDDLFSGNPAVLVEPPPLPFYDLRFDDTVGGSGPQRFDNPATWQPTWNPAVISYNIARGMRHAGNWFYGGQNVEALRLPPSDWMAAANECDISVFGRPQYQAGLEIDVSAEPLDVLEQFRLACNGIFVEGGGVLKLAVGGPGAAVYAFTDADVIITKPQELDPWPSLSDTHNTISASYPEPGDKWARKDAPEYAQDAAVVADGRSLAQSVTFTAVPWSEQVQHLQKTMIEDGRRMRVHTLVLPPPSRLLEAGDVIVWTSARNNYQDKAFQITTLTRLPGSLSQVTIKEIDPSDYDPPSIVIPPTTGLLGRGTPPVQIMKGWTVEPASMADGNGVGRLAAIKVSCGAGIDGVTAVVVQVRVRDTGQMLFSGHTTAYEEPYSWLIGPLPSKTWVEARGRFISDLVRNQEWSDWLEVETPNVMEDLGVRLDTVGEDVRKRFEELQADLDRSIGRSSELAIALSLQGSVGLLDRQVLRQQSGEALAQIIEEKLVRASEDEALAQTLELVGAEIADVSASVVEERQARVTADEAIAQQTSAVTALLNENFAAGQVKFAATANQSGVNARFSVLLRAGTSSGYQESGLYLEIYTEGGVQRSRFAVNADQFVVLNNGQRPFLFEGGVLKLNASHIGTIVAGLLRGSSGKTRLDLDNDYLSVSD